MAAYMGKDGQVNVGANQVALIDSFTLDLGIETDDVTAYGDSGRTNKQTLRTAAGSFVGTLDMSSTQAALVKQFTTATPTTVALRLYSITGDYFGVSATLNRCNIRSNVGTKVSVEFGFVKGAGNVTYTS